MSRDFWMWCFFFFKQKTAYEMRISDWSSDVCSSDLDDYVEQLEALFGGRLYIELSRRGDATEKAAEAALIDLAYARALPLVATNPANFVEPQFHPAHDAMLCIAQSAYVESEDRPASHPEAWLKPRSATRRVGKEGVGKRRSPG